MALGEKKNLKIIVAVGVLSGLAAGILLGYLIPKPNVTYEESRLIEKDTSRSIFNSQQATFNGKITEVRDGKLSVESFRGEKGEVVLAKQFLVLGFDKSPKTASGSADLKGIDTKKSVIMELHLIEGEFKVTRIQALPDAPLIDPEDI